MHPLPENVAAVDMQVLYGPGADKNNKDNEGALVKFAANSNEKLAMKDDEEERRQ